MKKIEKLINNEKKLILFSNDYIISDTDSLNEGFYANELRYGLQILHSPDAQIILRNLGDGEKINLKKGDIIALQIKLKKIKPQ